jgi:hypothetical protein
MYRALLIVISLLTQGVQVGLSPDAAGEGRLCVRLSTLAGVPLEDVCVGYRALGWIARRPSR